MMEISILGKDLLVGFFGVCVSMVGGGGSKHFQHFINDLFELKSLPSFECRKATLSHI